jgi:hypothetical protein
MDNFILFYLFLDGWNAPISDGRCSHQKLQPYEITILSSAENNSRDSISSIVILYLDLSRFHQHLGTQIDHRHIDIDWQVAEYIFHRKRATLARILTFWLSIGIADEIIPDRQVI